MNTLNVINIIPIKINLKIGIMRKKQFTVTNTMKN